MAYTGTTGLAGKVKKRNAGPLMTADQMTKPNPQASPQARLKDSGIGGAWKEGTKVLDATNAGTTPEGKVWTGGTPADFGKKNRIKAPGTTLSDGTTVQSSAANEFMGKGLTPKPTETSGVSPVSTPTTPTNALGSGSPTTAAGTAPGTTPSPTGTTPPTLGGASTTSSGLPMNNQSTSSQPTGEGYVLGLGDLDETQRVVYDSLSPTEKKTFEMIAANDYEARAKYLEQVNQDRESFKKLNTLKEKNTALTNEANIENSKQQLADARRKVEAMKRRTAYLGSRGQPGVSQAGLDSVNQEITRAEMVLDKMYKADSRLNQSQQIGVNYDAEIFAKQLNDIQNDLDNKIGKEFQTAYNKFNNAVLNGDFDTVEDVEKFREKLYAELDQNIVGASEANLKQMQFLVERGDKLAEDRTNRLESEAKAQAEQDKLKNTLNKDMSQALGYYVNGLGTPILDVKGQPIQTPPNIIGTPHIDEQSGYMTWLEDVNGVITPQSRQVMPGRPGDQTENIRVYDDFGGSKQITVYKGTNTPVMGALSSSSSQGGSNSSNQAALTSMGIQTDNSGNMTPASQDAIAKTCITLRAQDGKANPENMQCGALSNRYYQALTGSKGTMGNSYESKISTINSIGKSDKPVVGGLFVFKGPYVNGHTGIVTGVNSDGSINVLEANATGSPEGEGQPPEPGRYYDLKGFQFSQVPGAQKQSNVADKMDIYSVLTENGVSDTIAKKKATELASQGLTIDEVKKQYPNKNAADELTNLRKEFDGLQEVKDYKKVKNYYSTITKQAEKATAAGDLSMIFAYMKLLDPNSTVREGEFANAQNAAGIPDKIVNAYNKAKKGTRLNENQRKDFVSSAKTEFDTYANTYNEALNTYKGYVKYGGDPNEIGEVYKTPQTTQYQEGGVYTNPKDGKKYKYTGGKRYMQK